MPSGFPMPSPRRGAPIEPPNRFLPVHAERDVEHFEHEPELLEDLRDVHTEFIRDESKSIVSTNDSPDIPFRYSLNPYRGCEHGCAYCYARPTHEYFGLNAGIDFESKIYVKERAPELFREFLARPGWRPEPITFSGVTDCYQPAERRFGLTRGCLAVALEARQPVSIITKNALVLRDFDHLRELATRRLVHVVLSLTSLDPDLARTLEPRTSRPAARLRAIRELAAAEVPVSVMTAPVIPGLNDHEIPQLLEAAAAAGARSAGFTLLRLPYAVKTVFRDWLKRSYPSHAARVEGLIRQTRGGRLNASGFGERLRGEGPIAEQIATTFRVFARRYGLDQRGHDLDTTQFVPPRAPGGQKHLF